MSTNQKQVLPVVALEVTGILRSTSGKSSKLEVSSMDLILTFIAAGLSLSSYELLKFEHESIFYLTWIQSTPLNQDKLFRSSTLLTLFLTTSHMVRMASVAASEMGTSGGNTSDCLQSLILRYVSLGVSLRPIRDEY